MPYSFAGKLRRVGVELVDAGGIGSVAKGIVNGKVFAAYLVLYGSRFSWRIKTEGEFSGVERMEVGKALWRCA